MIKTSASRQLALSCTPTQSLLNLVEDDGLSLILSRRQISFANSGCALPLKITMALMASHSTPGIMLASELAADERVEHDSETIDLRKPNGLSFLLSSSAKTRIQHF